MLLLNLRDTSKVKFYLVHPKLELCIMLRFCTADTDPHELKFESADVLIMKTQHHWPEG